jgi:hypothetical protein
VSIESSFAAELVFAAEHEYSFVSTLSQATRFFRWHRHGSVVRSRINLERKAPLKGET